MAYDATNSFLLDRLIPSLIEDASEVDIERWKRSTLRILANSQYSTRVNQFDITARLEGLEEKWMIYNQDSLVEALHVRRVELSATSNRWIPEMLSLLLQLSDRRAQHPNHADLALLKPELAADIVAEDPLDDQDGIWENVDFGADDSDDDEPTESVHSGHSVLTSESSVAGQAVEACDETFIEPAPKLSLRAIQNAQLWRLQGHDKSGLICEEDEDHRPRENLTELQAGREVIFALLGLPTSIFRQGNEGQISISKSDFLKHDLPIARICCHC